LKGHSKDFKAFESFLDNKIKFLASLYTIQNVNDHNITTKFLHLLCMLSR
jgi:hypothetical protein